MVRNYEIENDIEAARQYAPKLPKGSQLLGVVVIGTSKGALVKLKSGVKVRFTDGTVRSLPPQETEFPASKWSEDTEWDPLTDFEYDECQ